MQEPSEQTTAQPSSLPFRSFVVALLALASAGCFRSAAEPSALSNVTAAARSVSMDLQRERAADGANCFGVIGRPTEEARACILSVESRWAPIWEALDVLEATDDDAPAGSVEHREALGAWCCLVASAPNSITLPTVPGVSCEARR
jgi:hypothetical protein